MNKNQSEVKSYQGYAIKMAIAIRGLRSMFSLNQDQLAKLANVSRPTINRLESLKEERGYRAETLDNLLNVFRSKGAEISVIEYEVVIKMPLAALLEAERAIRASSTPARGHENWKKGESVVSGEV